MSTTHPINLNYAFDPPPVPSLPVIKSASDDEDNDNDDNSHVLFPIHRIYCVGKNYAEHVQEMGGDVAKSRPVFFTKPNDAATTAKSIRYPPHTQNLHYECELVVAIGKNSNSDNNNNNSHHVIRVEEAPDYIYGFAVGLDLTRRDLQADAKAKGLPWDTAKYFDQSAPIGSITRRGSGKLSLLDMMQQQHFCRLELQVNGVVKQSAPLSQMIWTIPEIISELSTYYELRAGDLIMTGTPAGVGPVQVGDRIVGRVILVEEETENSKDVLEPVDIVLVE